ncbi:MAG: 16S rRNA (guanine(527)-N(7))-methyltransferase RsmG, partial [Alicyclobacillus shizuokensis]|nr:16S rRNA (guanine(527)-N(7))-methyltransferase RsmG [Alicyclobacillus shizuokensis]
IAESCAVAGLLADAGVLPSGARVIDVGSGGGLPGIPLAIVRPDARVTLLEATGKKAAFLERAVAALGLANARVIAARAEEVAHWPVEREAYDVATVRAVGHLAVVAELALPCVRVGGQVLAWKGRLSDEELDAGNRAARILGGEIAAVDRLVLPWSGAQRTMVRIEKRRPTPDRYPRRPGLPEKRPLGVEAQTRGEAENEGH